MKLVLRSLKGDLYKIQRILLRLVRADTPDVSPVGPTHLSSSNTKQPSNTKVLMGLPDGRV